MSEKHTPGPWRIYIQDIADKEQAKRELCQFVEGTPNFQPHLVYVTDDDWNLAPAITGCGEHSVANARLIAAAPDLLEALKEMVRLELLLETYGPLDRACNMARAAILKATEGEPS
jgi:hypothetical protein